MCLPTSSVGGNLALPWRIFAAREEITGSHKVTPSSPGETTQEPETARSSTHVEGPSQSRFAFVDGLRGLAALSIVVFHIWWYEPEPWPALESTYWIVEPVLLWIRGFPFLWHEPEPVPAIKAAELLVDATFLKLRGGVQVLLVISGFVIAYTLRNTWVTPREIFTFIGRRLVRLVPPYWVAIGFIILIDIVCRGFWDLPSPFDGDLSIPRVSAHRAFLQDVLGHEALGAGMWTICIEMQFYITAIIGWGLAQYLVSRPAPDEPRPSFAGLLTVFTPVALVSLFYWRQLESTSPWVVNFAWMFFIGMVTWWTLDRTLPAYFFPAIVVLAAVELVFDAEWRYENGVALATSIAIFIAGRRNQLHRWLNWPWLQYFGRISYSLYLIHFPVCHLLMSAGWKFCANTPTPVQASAILLTSFFASLCAAHLLYEFVEAPSARWSGKLKKATEQTVSVQSSSHQPAP